MKVNEAVFPFHSISLSISGSANDAIVFPALLPLLLFVLAVVAADLRPSDKTLTKT